MFDTSCLAYMKPWQWLFIAGTVIFIALLLVRTYLEKEIKRKERRLSRTSSSKDATLCWAKLQDTRYAFDVVNNAMIYMAIPVALASIYIIMFS